MWIYFPKSLFVDCSSSIQRETPPVNNLSGKVVVQNASQLRSTPIEQIFFQCRKIYVFDYFTTNDVDKFCVLVYSDWNVILSMVSNTQFQDKYWPLSVPFLFSSSGISQTGSSSGGVKGFKMLMVIMRAREASSEFEWMEIMQWTFLVNLCTCHWFQRGYCGLLWVYNHALCGKIICRGHFIDLRIGK